MHEKVLAIYKASKEGLYQHYNITKVNGKLIIDPKQKADALNSHFKSVFTEETDFQIPSKRLAPEMAGIIISTPGVSNLLRGIDTSKAMGPDNLSPHILKELDDVLVEPIASIYK